MIFVSSMGTYTEKVFAKEIIDYLGQQVPYQYTWEDIRAILKIPYEGKVYDYDSEIGSSILRLAVQAPEDDPWGKIHSLISFCKLKNLDFYGCVLPDNSFIRQNYFNPWYKKAVTKYRQASVIAEEKKFKEFQNTKIIIGNQLKTLSGNQKKIQDLQLPNLKLKANNLVSEIKRLTTATLIDLKGFEKKLIKINQDIELEVYRINARKIAQEKARVAQEMVDKKIALLPPKTKLEEAQIFLSDIKAFVVYNKDEFDFFEIVKFTKNTKSISEGILNDEQLRNLELFKEFVKSSNAFLNFQNDNEDYRTKSDVQIIDQLLLSANKSVLKLKSFSKENLTLTTGNLLDQKIKSSQLIIDNPKTFVELVNMKKDLELFLSDLEKEVTRIAQEKIIVEEKIIAQEILNKKIKKEFSTELKKINENLDNLKTYYVENMETISSDLTDLILDKITLIQNTKEGISSDNEKAIIIKFLKLNKDLSSFKLKNNIFTSDEVAAIKKAEQDKKVAQAEAQEKAEQDKFAQAKAQEKAEQDKKQAARKKRETIIETIKFAMVVDQSAVMMCGETPSEVQEVIAEWLDILAVLAIEENVDKAQWQNLKDVAYEELQEELNSNSDMSVLVNTMIAAKGQKAVCNEFLKNNEQIQMLRMLILQVKSEKERKNNKNIKKNKY
jgi:hypothetical protein